MIRYILTKLIYFKFIIVNLKYKLEKYIYYLPNVNSVYCIYVLFIYT